MWNSPIKKYSEYMVFCWGYHQLKKEDHAINRNHIIKKRYYLKEKLIIPLTRSDRKNQITREGNNIVYDPAGDRDCQFSEIA